MDKLIAMAKTFGQELSSADKELKQVKEELKELQDLLNKHKEGTLLKFQEVEIEDLKEENEKLKKRIEEEHKAVPSFLIQDMYHDAKEEIEKLKEENEKLKDTFTHGNIHEIAEKYQNLKEENEMWKKDAMAMRKGHNMIINLIKTIDIDGATGTTLDMLNKLKELSYVEDNDDIDKKQQVIQEPKKKKKIKKRKKKEFDYGESDDWVWGYGTLQPFAQKKKNEYVINISGGGDGVSPNGFEDWVIKKVGGELKYYIRHGGNIPDEEQKEGIVPMKIWTCPEGNYVSFQLPNYEPREGEMNFEDWLDDELEEEEETDEEEDE